MPTAPETSIIAHRIRTMLARGMDLSPETMRFIDSTFAASSAAELAAILDSDSDGEGDSLIELLFSPDDAFQLELEELLSERGVFESDVEAIAVILLRPALSVEFRLPEKRGAVCVAMTPELARRFLRRLRIDRSIPASLAAAIESRMNSRDRLRMRLLLRGARLDFTPSVEDFLGRLIERLDWDRPYGWEAFAFALELIAGLEDGADIHRRLAEWKQLLLNALNQGRRQREMVAAANIETLMSQGRRLTHVDEDAVQRQLACIDRICLAAFGRIAHCDPAVPEDAVAFDGPPDIADLIRRLS